MEDPRKLESKVVLGRPKTQLSSVVLSCHLSTSCPSSDDVIRSFLLFPIKFPSRLSEKITQRTPYTIPLTSGPTEVTKQTSVVFLPQLYLTPSLPTLSSFDSTVHTHKLIAEQMNLCSECEHIYEGPKVLDFQDFNELQFPSE